MLARVVAAAPDPPAPAPLVVQRLVSAQPGDFGASPTGALGEVVSALVRYHAAPSVKTLEPLRDRCTEFLAQRTGVTTQRRMMVEQLHEEVQAELAPGGFLDRPRPPGVGAEELKAPSAAGWTNMFNRGERAIQDAPVPPWYLALVDQIAHAVIQELKRAPVAKPEEKGPADIFTKGEATVIVAAFNALADALGLAPNKKMTVQSLGRTVTVFDDDETFAIVCVLQDLGVQIKDPLPSKQELLADVVKNKDNLRPPPENDAKAEEFAKTNYKTNPARTFGGQVLVNKKHMGGLRPTGEDQHPAYVFTLMHELVHSRNTGGGGCVVCSAVQDKDKAVNPDVDEGVTDLVTRALVDALNHARGAEAAVQQAIGEVHKPTFGNEPEARYQDPVVATAKELTKPELARKALDHYFKGTPLTPADLGRGGAAAAAGPAPPSPSHAPAPVPSGGAGGAPPPPGPGLAPPPPKVSAVKKPAPVTGGGAGDFLSQLTGPKKLTSTAAPAPAADAKIDRALIEQHRKTLQLPDTAQVKVVVVPKIPQIRADTKLSEYAAKSGRPADELFYGLDSSDLQLSLETALTDAPRPDEQAWEILDKRHGGGYEHKVRMVLLSRWQSLTLLHELGHYKQDLAGHHEGSAYVSVLEYHNVLLHENLGQKQPRVSYADEKKVRDWADTAGTRTWRDLREDVKNSPSTLKMLDEIEAHLAKFPATNAAKARRNLVVEHFANPLFAADRAAKQAPGWKPQ